MREQAVVSVPLSGSSPALLLSQFLQLPTEKQDKVLGFFDFKSAEAGEGDGELMAKLIRIVEFNSIQLYEEGETPSKNLYLNASLLNHSCKPNLVWYPEQGHIVVRVLAQVSKGSELTVCYFPTPIAGYTRGFGCPTLAQRRLLLQAFHFLCHCSLCLARDPEEDVRRAEFQQLDRQQESDGHLGNQLENARRKLELVEEIGGPDIFLSLVDCWKLSEFVSDQSAGADVQLKNLSRLYRERVENIADILGPAAREAVSRFKAVTLHAMEDA